VIPAGDVEFDQAAVEDLVQVVAGKIVAGVGDGIGIGPTSTG
jgi:hypothetical protein